MAKIMVLKLTELCIPQGVHPVMFVYTFFYYPS
jgi:hypothetical protein